MEWGRVNEEVLWQGRVGGMVFWYMHDTHMAFFFFFFCNNKSWQLITPRHYKKSHGRQYQDYIRSDGVCNVHTIRIHTTASPPGAQPAFFFFKLQRPSKLGFSVETLIFLVAAWTRPSWKTTLFSLFERVARLNEPKNPPPLSKDYYRSGDMMQKMMQSKGLLTICYTTLSIPESLAVRNHGLIFQVYCTVTQGRLQSSDGLVVPFYSDKNKNEEILVPTSKRIMMEHLRLVRSNFGERVFFFSLGGVLQKRKTNG